MSSRPFDNYRTAIDDPESFFGRTALVEYFREKPHWVHVLLGGQRIGKTSTLRAIEWTMLELHPKRSNLPFPLFVNMQLEQPHSADHFRYLLISRLRGAMGRFQETSWNDVREAYQAFIGLFDEVKIEAYFFKLKLKPSSPSALSPEEFRIAIQDSIQELRKANFRGVLFLLDEAEYVTRADWGNDAWSHIRGFKDTDALKGSVGFVISGFRGIYEYQQRVGSPLKNIAQTTWMNAFERKTSDRVVEARFAREHEKLRDGDQDFFWEYSGGYPFLLQQLINLVIDVRRQGDAPQEALIRRALLEHSQNFRDWWNAEGKTDGLTERERAVYSGLPERDSVLLDELATRLGAKPLPVLDALQVLCGSGLVREVGLERYEIGSQLFRKWTESW